MREAFAKWLRDLGHPETSVRDYCAEARRVEVHYGDLDRAYDHDHLQALLNLLTYTRDDERRGRKNPARFQIHGNTYNNLATYRSALRKFALFRESEARDGRR